jgi:hypothetical protein
MGSMIRDLPYTGNAPNQLENKRIHRFLHYSLRTSGLVLKIKNYVGFPFHVMGSMILDLPYNGNALTRPVNSI